MRKNDKLHIPISTEEKEKLKKKAELLGLSLSAYCLFILNGAKIKFSADT